MWLWSRCYFFHRVRNATLYISSVRNYDEGFYTCSASNSVGQDEKTTSLHIAGKSYLVGPCKVIQCAENDFLDHVLKMLFSKAGHCDICGIGERFQGRHYHSSMPSRWKSTTEIQLAQKCSSDTSITFSTHTHWWQEILKKLFIDYLFLNVFFYSSRMFCTLKSNFVPQIMRHCTSLMPTSQMREIITAPLKTT